MNVKEKDGWIVESVSVAWKEAVAWKEIVTRPEFDPVCENQDIVWEE